MPDNPQGRSVDGGVQKLEPENGSDLISPEEVTEPGRKRNVADPEWISMATADPAHFLNDLRPE